MIIRPRSEADGAALEAVAEATHQLDGYPKYLPEDLRSFILDANALRAWVAECDGEITGHVALHPRSIPEVMKLAVSATGLNEDQLVVLARLLVSPAARRRGIGRALVAHATLEARRLGLRAVLDVVDEHQDAVALYERLNWARAGTVNWKLPDGRLFREFVYISPEP